MSWGKYIAFILGAAGLVALAVYAGAGPIFQALRTLGVRGLLCIAVVHLPIVALMGLAWRAVAGELPGVTPAKFVWARLLRDAGAEVLPFSQIGGFVLGVRALHLSGVAALRGAVSMSVDLVMEICAKLPYLFIGLFAAFAISPHRNLVAASSVAVALTAGVMAIPLVFRRALSTVLERFAIALSRRWPDLGPHSELKSYFDAVFAEPRRLVSNFGIHLLCWILGAAEIWLTFALMGARIGLGQAVAIDSLVSTLRTFGFLVPAAAGVQEASYVFVCAMFGISPARAVALSLARRARDFVLGMPTLSIWQIAEARSQARNS